MAPHDKICVIPSTPTARQGPKKKSRVMAWDLGDSGGEAADA